MLIVEAETTKKELFHQDNARVHICVVTMVKYIKLDYELLAPPAYTPNLAPFHYFIFPNLKWLSGQRFAEIYFNSKVTDLSNCSRYSDKNISKNIRSRRRYFINKNLHLWIPSSTPGLGPFYRFTERNCTECMRTKDIFEQRFK